MIPKKISNNSFSTGSSKYSQIPKFETLSE